MSSVLLTRAGKPCGEIVLPPTAPAAEQHASKELRDHVERVSGARLPIVSKPTGGKAAVLVGRAAQAEQALLGFDWQSLGEDGCLVRTANGQLVLSGATPRGTLYAVYEFLERQLGCRWLTPSVTFIPKQSTVAIEALDWAHVPAFRYREPYFSAAFDPDWAARNRVNGQSFPLDEARGGKWTYAGFVHTFYSLLPPAEYFARHPEYFSEVDGQRVESGGQLCLTHPDVAELVAEHARQRLREQPDARIISISQNDWTGNCQCAACRKVDEAEGSPSGSLIRFVNAVAERLESEFPHVLVDTLAYTYTIQPPRHARPRKNVNIRLCHMAPCCDGHSLETCSLNQPFVDILRRWCAISPEVFIWDYFTNFHHYFMPFPNLDALCADLPLYAGAGVTGVFCQGDAGPRKGCGDMAELRAYVAAKLLWRPDLDSRAVIDDFLQLYYQAAAEPIRDYLELLHQPLRGKPVHFDLYCTLDQPFLSPDAIARAGRLFDEAGRRAEGDPELSDRVAAARLPVEYVQWKCGLRYVPRGNRYVPSDRAMAERAERFFALAIAHGAQSLREGGRPIADEATNTAGFDLAVIQLGDMKLAAAPVLGGRILSLLDPVSGHDWMHRPKGDEIDYPRAGGYEEYSGPRWRSPGWCEEYACRSTASSIQLTAQLTNGLILERLYRLESMETGPCLVIESTLKNAGNTMRRVQLRAHAELAADAFADLALRTRTPKGDWVEQLPWEGDVGDHWLQGDDKPGGAWGLRRGGRVLTLEFDPAAVAQCLCGWDRRGGLVRLDTYGCLADLAPGESRTLKQLWTPGAA